MDFQHFFEMQINTVLGAFAEFVSKHTLSSPVVRQFVLMPIGIVRLPNMTNIQSRKHWNTSEIQSSIVRCLLNFSFQKPSKVYLLVFLFMAKSLEPQLTMGECQHLSFRALVYPVPNNSLWQLFFLHKTILSNLSLAVGEYVVWLSCVRHIFHSLNTDYVRNCNVMSFWMSLCYEYKTLEL